MQIATNKRYAGNTGWTVSEVAERAAKDIGKIDVLVRGEAVGWGTICFLGLRALLRSPLPPIALALHAPDSPKPLTLDPGLHCPCSQCSRSP